MNLVKSLAVRVYVCAAVFVPTANAVDKAEFCENLTGLESHINGESVALNNAKNITLLGTTSSCACSEPDANDESANGFTINCSVEDSYPEGYTTVFFEKMAFESNGGEYSLRETSWGKEYEIFNLAKTVNVIREIFHLDDGVFTSCKANACKSCSICDDGTSMAVDCSHEEAGFTGGYASECGEGYKGSFVNTFDFGSITGGVVGEASPPTPAADDGSGDRDPRAFCQSLTELESAANESLEKAMGKTYTSGFACACGGPDADGGSFAVDCDTEGVDGNLGFVRRERMVFESISGEYELVETSWEAVDADGHDDREAFVLEGGIVVGCEAVGCASCAVCDDGTSIAADCTNKDEGFYSSECGDGYEGSFAHAFDFGVIAGAADSGATTVTGATEAATEQMSTAADESPDSNRLDAGDIKVSEDSSNALSSCKTSWMAVPGFAIATVLFISIQC